MPVPSAKTAHGPFDPKKRNSHYQKTNQVWNNKGAPAILHSLNRKS